MKINKKILSVIFVLLLICFSVGCDKTATSSVKNIGEDYSEPNNESLKAPDVEQSEIRWQITILNSEVKESLHTIGTTTLYDGSIKELPYNDVPPDGKVFLLLNLEIEKAQPGNSSFDWDKIAIIDESGNEYVRHENDSFLTSHNYERLPATSLKMGTTSGWACFQIDSQATQGKLYLVHYSEEGDNVLQIK